jgi:hypothetical protein
MTRRIRRVITVRSSLLSIAALIAVSGCKSLTDPKTRLDSFQWQAVDNPESVTDGMDAVGFAGDVDIIGQLKTPTLCFNLEADYSRSGATLQLHVSAKPSNSATCNQNPGGYQYTAAIRAVGAGTYTMRVVHSLPGTADKTFEKEVVIR